MNYCQRGREIVADLKRAEWLPRYEEEGIRIVLQECNTLWDKVIQVRSHAQTDATKVSQVFHSQCVLRNKKYIESYILYRMNKIKELRWQTGAVLPEATVRAETLSVAEADYFTNYNKLLNDYCDAVDFDLTTCIEPPKDYKIMVRVLKDYGEILVENGMLRLIKGGTHYLRRTDVEDLIRQGVVEHISSNMF